MPQLGETVTEGTIIRWLKKVGDPIAHDEPLFEVSTDKVDSEVPSPASGYLAEILVPEGETVDVGTKLAVVTDSGAFAAGKAPAAAPRRRGRAGQAPADRAGSPRRLRRRAEAAAPAAQVRCRAPAAARRPGAPRAAAAVGAPRLGARQTRTGRGSSSRRSCASSSPSTASTRPRSPAPGRAAGSLVPTCSRSSTAKRRGRRPAPARPAARAPSAPAPARGAGRSAVAARAEPVRGQEHRRHPLVSARGRHARRGRPVHQHPPAHRRAHGALEGDVGAHPRGDRGGLRGRRAGPQGHTRTASASEEGISLTYLPFIARAVVETLRDYPQLNASVGDDALIVHHDVHLGIAVDLEQRGPRSCRSSTTPTVSRCAASPARSPISPIGPGRASSRLTTSSAGRSRSRTRARSARSSRRRSSTSRRSRSSRPTGSSAGRSSITAPDGTEAIGIHSVGLLALSFDHRAVDGAYASAFLRDLAQVIETRDWAAEL